MNKRGIKAAARGGAQASGREQKRGRAPRFARSQWDSIRSCCPLQPEELFFLKLANLAALPGDRVLRLGDISTLTKTPLDAVVQTTEGGVTFIFALEPGKRTKEDPNGG